jgi:hypothetical protein
VGESAKLQTVITRHHIAESEIPLESMDIYTTMLSFVFCLLLLLFLLLLLLHMPDKNARLLKLNGNPLHTEARCIFQPANREPPLRHLCFLLCTTT